MTSEPIERRLSEILRRRWPSVRPDGDLGDVPLGADGLGLDSVAVVELLLECETVFDVRLPPEALDGAPPTIGRVVALIQAAGAAASSPTP
jgi:acyl carrier protein